MLVAAPRDHSEADNVVVRGACVRRSRGQEQAGGRRSRRTLDAGDLRARRLQHALKFLLKQVRFLVRCAPPRLSLNKLLLLQLLVLPARALFRLHPRLNLELLQLLLQLCEFRVRLVRAAVGIRI